MKRVEKLSLQYDIHVAVNLNGGEPVIEYQPNRYGPCGDVRDALELAGDSDFLRGYYSAGVAWCDEWMELPEVISRKLTKRQTREMRSTFRRFLWKNNGGLSHPF